MERAKIIDSPRLKIAGCDFETEYEVEIISEDSRRVDDRISQNQKRIEELDPEIDRLTSHTDDLDNIVAVGSGLIAGIIDSLWVGEFQFERGKAWSNTTVNEFVMKVSKSKGYQGERLDGAIKFLEDKFPIPSDSIWKGQDIGISAKSHHLDDLSHHPTPVGLFFSMLTQFTKTGHLQNSAGQFFSISIDENGQDLIGSDVPTKIFCGTVNWFFHLASDMSGSAKTAGVGMGVPGPIVSLLKELSTIPGLDKTGLTKYVKKVFVDEKFDLRSELSIAHELGRQAVPVVINEVIVRAFYFIRRLLAELKEKKKFDLVDWKTTLPWKNRTIVRMLTISTGTFTAVDLADAAIRAGIKSVGDPTLFASQFLLRVNFVGVGRTAVAVGTDVYMGGRRESLRNERIQVLSQQLHLLNAKVFYRQSDLWKAAETTERTINDALSLGEKSAEIFAMAWVENRKSMRKIGDALHEVEKKNPKLITDIQDTLKWGSNMTHELATANKAASAKDVDRKSLPDLIAGHIGEVKKLDLCVKAARTAAELAVEQTKSDGSKPAGWDFTGEKKKAAIVGLQSALMGLAKAVESGAKAQELSFEFQEKLADVTKQLFFLGMSNIANNQSVVHELEARLKGASEEELSDLARRELFSVLEQLKEQEYILQKQEDNSKALREHDGKLKDCVQMLDLLEVALKSHENVYMTHESKLSAQAEGIEQQNDQILLLKTEIVSLKSSLATQRKKGIGLATILFLLVMAGVIFICLFR